MKYENYSEEFLTACWNTGIQPSVTEFKKFSQRRGIPFLLRKLDRAEAQEYITKNAKKLNLEKESCQQSV